MTLRGVISQHSPMIAGHVRAGELHLGTRGALPLVVDTGFTGAFAVPEEVARSLDLEFVGFDTFTLATGQEVELPVYLGLVWIGRRRVNTWFIMGEGLVGMEFLEQTCSSVQMNPDQEALTLHLKRGKARG